MKRGAVIFSLAGSVVLAVGMGVLLVLNRLLWLVGVSTVTADLPGAPSGLLDLLVAVARLPWWVLAGALVFILGWQVWVAIKVAAAVTAMEEEVARQKELSASFREAVEQMEETRQRIEAVEQAAVSGFGQVAEALQEQLAYAAMLAPHAELISKVEQAVKESQPTIDGDPSKLSEARTDYLIGQLSEVCAVLEPIANRISANFYPQDYWSWPQMNISDDLDGVRRERAIELRRLYYLFISSLGVVRGKTRVLGALPLRLGQTDARS